LSVKMEQVDKNVVCLEVEVDEDKVKAAIAAAARSLAHRIKIPGFRKGRAPKHILELTLGKEALLDEALELLVPEAYGQAVEDQGLEPIDRPQVEVITIKEDVPLVFKATVEIKPEVLVGEYKGLVLEKERVKVKDEEIEQFIEKVREQQAVYEAAEDEPATEGDLITVDFSATVAGHPFEGSEAENMPLMVGKPGFFPGLSQQLSGVKKDDTRVVKITLPDEFTVADLAGQEAEFEIKVKGVRKRRLPEVDDDFAQSVGEYKTVAELKDSFKNNLRKLKEKRIREKMESQAMELIMAETEVEVPSIMAERRAHTMLRNFAYELQYRGTTLEDYCEYKKTTKEKIIEELIPAASLSVKQELILDAIVKKENLVVSPDKLDKSVQELLTDDMDLEEAKERWSEDGTLTVLTSSLLRQEAREFILREAVVTEVEPEANINMPEAESKTEAGSEAGSKE
jgi:trigger factor